MPGAEHQRQHRARVAVEPFDRAPLEALAGEQEAAPRAGGLCLRISTAHSAGVALIATSSEMPTASRNATDSGRKNVPWISREHEDRQERHRHRGSGIEHRQAYFQRRADEELAGIELRAGSAALRRLRVMFSTSITASSTTTPSATTRPPMLIVFSDSPSISRIQTVASSDSGIDENEISAPRQSRKVASSKITTSTAPMSSEARSRVSARSMKLAGRSSAGW